MKRKEGEGAFAESSEHMDDAEYAAAQEVVHKLELVIRELDFEESPEMRVISSSTCPATEAEAEPIVKKWYEMGQALVDAAGQATSIEYRKANLGFQLAYASLFHWWGVGEKSLEVFEDCLRMVEQDEDLRYLLNDLHKLL